MKKKLTITAQVCLSLLFSVQVSHAQKQDSLKVIQWHINRIATELNISTQKAALVERAIMINHTLISKVVNNNGTNFNEAARHRLMAKSPTDTAFARAMAKSPTDDTFAKTMNMLNADQRFKLRIYLLKGKMHQDSMIQRNAQQLRHPKGGTLKTFLKQSPPVQNPNHQ